MYWSTNKITRFKWCNRSLSLSHSFLLNYSIKSRCDFFADSLNVCMCLSNQCHEYRLFLLLNYEYRFDFQYAFNFSDTYFAMTNWTFGCHFWVLCLLIKKQLHWINELNDSTVSNVILEVTMVSTVTLKTKTCSAAANRTSSSIKKWMCFVSL